MYEPNYAKIQAQQDAEASIMAANLFQLAKEQTRAEIVERRKDKVKQIGDDIVETIKACFWRGFYNGTQDAKTDIANLSKQKGKKSDLASTFSFSNFMTNALDVIEFEESEEEKLRKKLAELKAREGKLRGFVKKDAKGKNIVEETQLQKQIREIEKQLTPFKKIKPEVIDTYTKNQGDINKLKKEINNIIKNQPEYAKNIPYKQDEIKRLQRSNAKIRKEVPNIGELATERLMAKVAEPQTAPKRKSKARDLLNPAKTQPASKPKKEAIPNNDPRVQEILTSEIRNILAKSENDRDRREQAKLNNAEARLAELGKSFKTNKLGITSVTQRRQNLQTNKYRIERDRLEQLAQQQPVGYNSKKDKPEQALKRSIYRMEDKRNRERFITLNTEYPSLFDNDENNSFFARYLNQRALTISDGLKKSQEDDIKSRVVGFASDTGVSGKGVIELIQKNLKDPKQAVAVDRLSKRIGSKREGLRLTNEQYLERYQEWTNKATKAGSNQAETLKDPKEKRFATLIAKEQKGIELSDAEFEELDNLEGSLSQKRQDEIANLITQPTEKLDAEKLAKLKQLAKDNPKGLANFDRKARATLTLPEIQALKNTIGEKAYNWATNKAEVGPNGEIKLNSAHLLKLQEKLDQVGLNNDTKLMQRATSIATTEISAAYNLGRLQVYLDNGVRYVQYTATLDTKTTVFCQSLHMKIYPLRELLIQTMVRTFFPDTDTPATSPDNLRYASTHGIAFWCPPSHINAYLPNTKVASISPEMLMRKRYKGKAVTFYTEHGNSLSCTIEHPILTTNGFIRAENLKVGDYVFDTFLGDSTVISVPDYKNSIPCVEDLFNLFSVPVSNSIMPIPTLDLDSQVTNNKINIKPFAGNLSKNIIETEIDEVLINPIFECTGEALVSKACLGTTHEFNQSILPFSASLISRSYSLPTLFGRIPCAEDLLGLGTFTDTLSVFSQNTFYNTLIYTDFLGHFSHTNTQRVKTNKDFNDLLAQSNFSFKPSDMQVKRSKIVNIVVEEYEGFVYHVQDASGINIANGIVAHNCRSFLLPIYTDDIRDELEKKENVKKYKLEVSKEIETSQARDLKRAKSASWNSVARDLKNKGTLTSYDDKFIQKVRRIQARYSRSQIKRSLDNYGRFADLFTDGYRYLANYVRSKNIRLEDGGQLVFEEDDIKKNDRILTNLLLGSGMVLGFGAMLYFFSKSNLASALRDYINSNIDKVWPFEIFGARKATPEEVAENLGIIGGLVQNIPQDIIDQVVGDANRQIVDLKPKDVTQKANAAEDALQKIALESKDKDIDTLVANISPDNPFAGKTLDIRVDGEIIPNNLTPKEKTKFFIDKVLSSMNRDLNTRLVPQYREIVREALGNSKKLKNGLDLSTVREIKNLGAVLEVKFRPGFGAPTLLSKKRLKQALTFGGRRELLQSMRQEVDRKIELLDEWARNLDSKNDETSRLEKSLIIKTRKELAELQEGLNGFATNFEYFRKINYDALPDETWGDVKGQFSDAIISEAEKATLNIVENLEKIEDIPKRIFLDIERIKNFDPEYYGREFFENFNIGSYFDYSIENLRSLELQVDGVIAQVAKKYFNKSNKPYNLGVASRRIKNGESDYLIAKQVIDENMRVLRTYGRTEEVDPNLVSYINDSYVDQIQYEYERMVSVKLEISNKIKELESNNQ